MGLIKISPECYWKSAKNVYSWIPSWYRVKFQISREYLGLPTSSLPQWWFLAATSNSDELPYQIQFDWHTQSGQARTFQNIFSITEMSNFKLQMTRYNSSVATEVSNSGSRWLTIPVISDSERVNCALSPLWPSTCSALVWSTGILLITMHSRSTQQRSNTWTTMITCPRDISDSFLLLPRITSQWSSFNDGSQHPSLFHWDWYNSNWKAIGCRPSTFLDNSIVIWCQPLWVSKNN